MSDVAVLGMGAMGSRMARNLIESGHTVTVWNRTPEKTRPLVEAGATAADSPAAAAGNAEVVISMVRDDEASRSVWLAEDGGAARAIRTDGAAVESSTITVAWARELAGIMSERGVPFLDAPVLGSRPQAESGELIHFAGGDADLVERVGPVLSSIGSALHHAGPAGSGSAMKLMVNALLTMQIAALGELLPFVRALGVEEERAVEILASTPVCSASAKGAAGRMIARDHSPLFPIELVEKDLEYVLATADQAGTRIPLSRAVYSVYAEALALGMGHDNSTAVARIYD